MSLPCLVAFSASPCRTILKAIVREHVLVLYLMLVGKFKFLAVRYDVSDGYFVDRVFQVEEVLL